MRALLDLQELGYRPRLENDEIRLVWRGRGEPDAEKVQPLLEQLRSRKHEAIQYLRKQTVGVPFEEDAIDLEGDAIDPEDAPKRNVLNVRNVQLSVSMRAHDETSNVRQTSETSEPKLGRHVHAMIGEAMQRIAAGYISGTIDHVKAEEPELWDEIRETEGEVDRACLAGRVEDLQDALGELERLWTEASNRYRGPEEGGEDG
jgi:hypothetical protein